MLLVQPMCLLTSLLISSTNLIYSCVSRYCACQRLPLLKFFIITIAIVTHYLFTRFPSSFHIDFYSAFEFVYSNTSKSIKKNPNLTNRVFQFSLVVILTIRQISPDSHKKHLIRFFNEVVCTSCSHCFMFLTLR